MNKSLFKALRLLSIAFFIISSIIIAFFHFPNRDLTLLVETTEQEYELRLSSDYINNSDVIELEISDVDDIIVRRVRCYGSIKSICLRYLKYSEFATDIECVPNGEMKGSDEGLHLMGVEGVKVVLNADGVELFQKLSKSFLLERLCLIEIMLIINMMLFVVFIALEEKYDLNNRNNHGPIYEFKRFWKDIKKYTNYMIYAAKTDLKAEVANSYLNRLWWLLEPLFNMMVYVVVFGNIMGRSIENYATFVFSALLMWGFFNKTIHYSVKLVRSNKDIVTKVYVPKFVLLISNMLLNFFKLLFSMIILVVMLFIFRIHIGIEILMIIPAYFVMFLLAFGLGMIFLHYGVYVDDLSYAVGILLNMLMFLSGIFYEVMSSLKDPLNTLILCLNPIAMMVDTMRKALLYQEVVNLPILVIWFLISLILCFIGVHIVYKNENGYVKVV